MSIPVKDVSNRKLLERILILVRQVRARLKEM